MNWPAMAGQQEMDFGMSSGKTSSEFSQTREMPSDASLADLWALMPPSSHQQGESGAVRVWSLDRRDVPRGVSLMPNTSEWPNDADVCLSSLSEVLETGEVPPRYFLSAEACTGILRRAEKRGKKLPEQLQHALLQVVQAAGLNAPQLSTSR